MDSSTPQVPPKSSRQLRRQAQRHINKQRVHLVKTLKIESTDERLTSTSGLGPILDVFQQSPLADAFAQCLPLRVSPRSKGSYQLALALMASFIYGHDCLDDLEEFRQDPHFECLFKDGAPAPRTMGDFLRDFDEENVGYLNKFLHQMAMSLRQHLKESVAEEYRPGPLIIDIDSTSHEQSAKKMEGLAYNYKDEWCLDSQVAFDKLGFCHGVQLRPGNTKSGVNAEELIRLAFSGLKHQDEKYLRGDSAYCYQDVIKTCLAEGAIFTLTAHGNIKWEEKVNKIKNWEPWVYTEEDVEKAAKRGRELPVVELGRYHWTPGWAPHLKFPVVIKRTWRETGQMSLFGEWDYYAVVTNFDLYLHSYQHVMEHHQKRGNSENFIREGKYNYDLKHFGCQKLRANHAYLQIAMVSHNLMRWLAYLSNPSKPHYAKKLRRRLITIPGKLVSHAKQLVLRIPHRFFKEVVELMKAWQATPIPVFSTG